jgi:hypothetical protein
LLASRVLIALNAAEPAEHQGKIAMIKPEQAA